MDIFANPTAHLDKSHPACRAPAKLSPATNLCARRTRNSVLSFMVTELRFKLRNTAVAANHQQANTKTSMTNITAIVTTLQSDTLPEAFTIGPMIPGAIMRGSGPRRTLNRKGSGALFSKSISKLAFEPCSDIRYHSHKSKRWTTPPRHIDFVYIERRQM